MSPAGSIFVPTSSSDRRANFESYWEFSKKHAGELYEEDRDLARKREKLRYFQANPVRSRKPLAQPEVFYKNYVHLKDDPTKIDRKTLLLMCIYKFARHEWVGISGAWDATKPLDKAKSVTDKISRVHLAEEFCHVRFFHEMLRTFHLDRVEWVPLGPIMQRIYKLFPYVPEALMAPPAFVTEMMGISFYCHVNALLNDVFHDEPEARERVRELLFEIMIDETAHIGQRRNFIGNFGIKVSQWIIGPLFKMFFNDIPESKHLFDINRLIEDAKNFDYSCLPEAVVSKSWIPTYCTRAPQLATSSV